MPFSRERQLSASADSAGGPVKGRLCIGRDPLSGRLWVAGHRALCSLQESVGFQSYPGTATPCRVSQRDSKVPEMRKPGRRRGILQEMRRRGFG